MISYYYYYWDQQTINNEILVQRLLIYFSVIQIQSQIDLNFVSFHRLDDISSILGRLAEIINLISICSANVDSLISCYFYFLIKFPCLLIRHDLLQYCSTSNPITFQYICVLILDRFIILHFSYLILSLPSMENTIFVMKKRHMYFILNYILFLLTSICSKFFSYYLNFCQ